MKNIFFLIAISLFLASCTCDETNPIVSGEEITVPDNFMVTDVGYFPTRNAENQLINTLVISFNREIERELIAPGENFFLEGDSLFFRGNVTVLPTAILVYCGNFECLQDPCQGIIRMLGTGPGAIRSTNGEVLDGDRDGQPGGDFEESISLSDCLIGPFQVSFTIPVEDRLQVSAIGNVLNLRIFFTLEADISSVLPGDNLQVASVQSDGSLVDLPFTLDWFDFPNIVDLSVADPLRACEFNPDCELRLIIKDSVRSAAGTLLDGDGDGEEGGTFTKVYIIEG